MATTTNDSIDNLIAEIWSHETRDLIESNFNYSDIEGLWEIETREKTYAGSIFNPDGSPRQGVKVELHPKASWLDRMKQRLPFLASYSAYEPAVKRFKV